MRWQREMMVGNSNSIWSVTKIIVVFEGGSSNNFRNAFADSPWPADRRCASNTSTTFLPLVSPFKDYFFLNSRID